MGRSRRRRQTIEQVVLLAIEGVDPSVQPIAMGPKSIRVAAGRSVLPFGQWRLRDQGTEPCIIRFAGELGELLLGDGQVISHRAELRPHGAKTTLDLGPSHGDEHRLTPMMLRRWIAAIGVAVSGCGADAPGGCVEVREAEDPASSRHIVGDGPVEYLTDPPTSGAHAAGPTPEGLVDVPIARPIQVRILEGGGVLIQFDPVIDGDRLAPLAGVDTVVAPSTDLPSPVVATAWTWKLSCDAVDPDRLRTFADARRGDAPGAD